MYRKSHLRSLVATPILLTHTYSLFRMKSIIAASLVFAASAAADRTFTVYNACPFTIWYVQPHSGSSDQTST